MECLFENTWGGALFNGRAPALQAEGLRFILWHFQVGLKKTPVSETTERCCHNVISMS